MFTSIWPFAAFCFSVFLCFLCMLSFSYYVQQVISFSYCQLLFLLRDQGHPRKTKPNAEGETQNQCYSEKDPRSVSQHAHERGAHQRAWQNWYVYIITNCELYSNVFWIVFWINLLHWVKNNRNPWLICLCIRASVRNFVSAKVGQKHSWVLIRISCSFPRFLLNERINSRTAPGNTSES